MRLKLSATLYLAGLAGLAGVCLVYYLPQVKLSKGFLITWGIFSFISFFAQVYEVELTYRRYISTTGAVFVAAIMLGGAPWAIPVVLAATLVAEIILRWDRLSLGVSTFINYVVFNLSQLIIAVTAASSVFTLIGGHVPPYRALVDFIPPSLAFLTYVFVNTSLVSGIIHLTEGVSFTYSLKFNLRHLHVQLLSLGVLSILMAVVYAMSPWYLFLVLIPLALVHVSLRGYMRLRRQAEETFELMTKSLMERDYYTGAHSEKVSMIAQRMARALGLPENEVERIGAAARVHDIGKIAIPDNILLKQDGLTEEEWQVIQQHPVVSAELLQGLEIYDESIEIIKHHHEHWDGSGYPDGLKGEQIPLGARILAVADVHDALTSDRPYRPAYSEEEALQIIERMGGRELDPQVVEAFLKVI